MQVYKDDHCSSEYPSCLKERMYFLNRSVGLAEWLQERKERITIVSSEPWTMNGWMGVIVPRDPRWRLYEISRHISRYTSIAQHIPWREDGPLEAHSCRESLGELRYFWLHNQHSSLGLPDIYCRRPLLIYLTDGSKTRAKSGTRDRGLDSASLDVYCHGSALANKTGPDLSIAE
ncbi:hypothetical protein J6590_086549 [Homalodisca vitripennis]|nr:hypothetical protein J6590_086549 [Homalodisca vitripennis]